MDSRVDLLPLLANELLMYITSFVHTADLASCTRVNIAWNQLFETTPSVWREKLLREFQLSTEYIDAFIADELLADERVKTSIYKRFYQKVIKLRDGADTPTYFRYAWEDHSLNPLFYAILLNEVSFCLQHIKARETEYWVELASLVDAKQIAEDLLEQKRFVLADVVSENFTLDEPLVNHYSVSKEMLDAAMKGDIQQVKKCIVDRIEMFGVYTEEYVSLSLFQFIALNGRAKALLHLSDSLKVALPASLLSYAARSGSIATVEAILIRVPTISNKIRLDAYEQAVASGHFALVRYMLRQYFQSITNFEFFLNNNAFPNSPLVRGLKNCMIVLSSIRNYHVSSLALYYLSKVNSTLCEDMIEFLLTDRRAYIVPASGSEQELLIRIASLKKALTLPAVMDYFQKGSVKQTGLNADELDRLSKRYRFVLHREERICTFPKKTTHEACENIAHSAKPNT